MNGQLGEFPLAELIHEIGVVRLSGALRLERERVKASVYFDDGELVYAASNLRAYRLLEVARRAGITERQLTQAHADVSLSDAELGAAFVETKALTAEALQKLLRRQIVEVLQPMLLWISGEWRFEPRARLAEQTRVKIDLPELLMEAARRLPDELASKQFPSFNEMLFPEPAAASAKLNFLPTEAFVLSRLETPARLHEIISLSGLPEPEALRIVYTLAVGCLLRRENPHRAFTDEEATHMLAAQAKLAAAKAAASPIDDNASTPDTKQSDDEMAKPAVIVEDEQQLLEEMFARLERATTHYAVLGVVQRAKPDEIKRAYHAHARRFHPDRFHKDVDKALHARIEAIFARVAQAYDTLANKSARATYDLKLESQANADRKAQTPAAVARDQQSTPRDGSGNSNTSQNTPARETNQTKSGQPSFTAKAQAAPNNAPSFTGQSQAEHYFQQGLAAMQQGNQVLATARFSEAVRLDSQQPRYRAHYGRALAANAQTRHRAEAELKAAIQLDTKDASYRVMLAEFYRSIGLQRRAESEAESALALDPRNEAARQLLNVLRAAAKTTLRT